MAYTAWSVVFGEQPAASKWNILGTNDASFNDGTGIAVSAITPEKLLTGTGTTWPWSSWSPSWTNLTVGNGTQKAFYRQLGKTIDFQLSFVFGTTSSISGAVSFTAPATLSSNYVLSEPNGSYVGGATLLDSGTSAYPGAVRTSSSTLLRFQLSQASGTYTNLTDISSTTPFTWGTADTLFAWGTYEAA